jgi:maleylpyruvate isomerase
MTASLKLFNYWRSSCSWRVRIALAHKNLSYEYVPVNLVQGGGEQFKAEYRSLNPMAQVPTLVVDGDGKSRAIAQSLAIIEYLEEAYPNPPLLPKDAFLRAKVREVAHVIASGIQPLQNLTVQQYVEKTYNGDKAQFAAHWVSLGLANLEALCKALAGKCLVGDTVTMADACLVPQLYGARRVNVDTAAYPTLRRVEEYLTTLPAFQQADAAKQIDAQKVS